MSGLSFDSNMYLLAQEYQSERRDKIKKFGHITYPTPMFLLHQRTRYLSDRILEGL